MGAPQKAFYETVMKKFLFSPRRTLPLVFHSLRWHLAYYLRRKSFPLACGIFLTNRCNLQCRMCTIWADRNKQSLNLDRVRHLIDAFTPGLCYLSFSGGEPLLVPDLAGMIAYAAARIPYVHLVTNGLRMDGATARELARAGLTEISISLDGERDWHNWVRRSEKSFDAAVTAIKTVRNKAPGVGIVVNSVMFPEAPEQVEKALAITRSLGVHHKIQPVNTHFAFEQTAKQPDAIRFGAAKPQEIQNLIRRISSQSHLVNSRAFLQRIPDYFAGRLVCPAIRPKCLVPHFFLEASAYGKISPCMMATGWDGTLEMGPDLAREKDGAFFAGQKRRLETCRACDRSMYICYWEPMMSFPAPHLLRFGLWENRS